MTTPITRDQLKRLSTTQHTVDVPFRLIRSMASLLLEITDHNNLCYEVWRSTDSCGEFYSWDECDKEDYDKAHPNARRIILILEDKYVKQDRRS